MNKYKVSLALGIIFLVFASANKINQTIKGEYHPISNIHFDAEHKYQMLGSGGNGYVDNTNCKGDCGNNTNIAMNLNSKKDLNSTAYVGNNNRVGVFETHAENSETNSTNIPFWHFAIKDHVYVEGGPGESGHKSHGARKLRFTLNIPQNNRKRKVEFRLVANGQLERHCALKVTHPKNGEVYTVRKQRNDLAEPFITSELPAGTYSVDIDFGGVEQGARGGPGHEEDINSDVYVKIL